MHAEHNNNKRNAPAVAPAAKAYAERIVDAPTAVAVSGNPPIATAHCACTRNVAFGTACGGAMRSPPIGGICPLGERHPCITPAAHDQLRGTGKAHLLRPRHARVSSSRMRAVAAEAAAGHCGSSDNSGA